MEWAKRLDGEMVDTRNWELMPSIGGSRRLILDLDHLKLAEDTPGGLLVKIKTENAFAQYLVGGEVELPNEQELVSLPHPRSSNISFDVEQTINHGLVRALLIY